MDEPFELKLARIARACHEAEAEVARLTTALAEANQAYSEVFEKWAEAQSSREAYRTDAHTARELARTWAEKYDAARAELAEAKAGGEKYYAEIKQMAVRINEAARIELAAGADARTRGDG